MSIGNELLRDLFGYARGSENWYFNSTMFPGYANDNTHPLIKHWALFDKKDLNKCDDMALLLNEVLSADGSEKQAD